MHFLKYFTTIFLLTCLITNCSSQKEPAGIYDEKNYVEERRGIIDGRHTILFRNKDNSDYTIRRILTKSPWSDTAFIVTKIFLYKDFLNGPTETLSDGHVTSKGFFKMNKKHGEFILYDSDDNVIEKIYYKEGKRTGTWEYYNSNQILHKKVYYNDKGEFVKKELFNQKTGKYERTEYEPDIFRD